MSSPAAPAREYLTECGLREWLWGDLVLAALHALTLPEADRERLRGYYCDAVDPISEVYCGLERVDIVGIAGDGTYLYGPREIGASPSVAASLLLCRKLKGQFGLTPPNE